MAQATNFVALFYMLFFQLDLMQCNNQKLQKPNISPECESMGICVSVENYPTELVKGLIDKLKSQNTIFNYDEPESTIYSRFNEYDEDHFTSRTKPLLKIHNTIFNYDEPEYDEDYFTSRTKPLLESGMKFSILNTFRSSFRDHDEVPRPTFNTRFNDKKPLSLCETTPQFVPLEGAKDMNGNWQFIINESNEPLQVFRIEICRTHMGRCSENISFMPGYNGKCIQKMVFREMFYVNETKNIGRTYFEVPTCCSCTLFRKDNDK